MVSEAFLSLLRGPLRVVFRHAGTFPGDSSAEGDDRPSSGRIGRDRATEPDDGTAPSAATEFVVRDPLVPDPTEVQSRVDDLRSVLDRASHQGKPVTAKDLDAIISEWGQLEPVLSDAERDELSPLVDTVLSAGDPPRIPPSRGLGSAGGRFPETSGRTREEETS